MKIKNIAIPAQQEAEIKTEMLKAIDALNKLSAAGVNDAKIVHAKFLLKTWFKEKFDSKRDPVYEKPHFDLLLP